MADLAFFLRQKLNFFMHHAHSFSHLQVHVEPNYCTNIAHVEVEKYHNAMEKEKWKRAQQKPVRG